MIASALCCPHCQATMRSAKPIPAGTRVKCPKCGTPFVVPTDAAGAVTAGAVTATAPVKPPDSLIGPDAAHSVPDVALPEGASSGGKRGLVAVAVAGSAFLLLGGGLLLYCLRSGGTTEDPAPGVPQENELPVGFEPKFQAPPQPLVVLSPDEEQKVKEATLRGVAFLKKIQDPEGYWEYNKTTHRAGATALASLTLLESGVTRDDPAVQKATAFLRESAPKLNMTYDISLAILFFNRLGDAQDKGIIRDLGLRLIAGQTAGGGWGYACPILDAAGNEQLVAILRRLGETRREERAVTRKSLQKTAPKVFKALAVLDSIKKGDDSSFKAGGGDNSNTQFALLALWTARRHEVPVDPSLSLVARRFRASQNKDGSFGYTTTTSGKPSMTCAGLLGLAVGFGIMEKGTAPAPLHDNSVKEALRYLSKSIGQPRQDPKAKPLPLQPLYTLWSIERVAVLYQLKEIEGKHWYQWGMDVLLSHQKADGHWGTGPGGKLVDTSFALLFLQRVNLAGDLTDKLKEIAAMMGNNPMPLRNEDD